MNPTPRSVLAALLVALSTTAHAAGMRVTSTSFAEGGAIPALHAADGPCGGQNISPQVSWSDLPAGARSVVVLMTEPDDGRGAGIVHWVAYDISAARGELRQGEGDKTDVGIVVGRDASGRSGYRGMCPPVGDMPHRYVVTVIASDLPPDALPPDLGRDEVLKAQQGHALDEQRTVGRFAR